ncbi:MAG: PAS domain-containing protein, partial [Mucilaginibacter sp.]
MKETDQITFSAEKYQFLAGAGEMAELTRLKDWSKTPVGPAKEWPQSLQTTLSIVLKSKFPMFLWWGPELVCFYNDAYRPSLGNDGKHPTILGMTAKEAWPEIWDMIKPLIDQVLAGGEATWSEDQLVPIYRNGTIEDVYWTFSYSPVNDESGKVAGVLVICTETTEKINTQREIEERERNLLLVIKQAPVAIAIFRGPGYIVEVANAHALKLWGRKEKDVINKPILEVMSELVSQGIKDLLDDVYKTGKHFKATELPVKILRNDKMEMVYVNFVYQPLYDSYGTINGIISIGTEVTDHVVSRKEVEESEERFRSMAESTDILIGVGDDTSNATYFNKAWVELTGRPMDVLLKFGWADLVHPEDKEDYVNIYLKAFAKRTSFTGEFRVLNKAGSYRW